MSPGLVVMVCFLDPGKFSVFNPNILSYIMNRYPRDPDPLVNVNSTTFFLLESPENYHHQATMESPAQDWHDNASCFSSQFLWEVSDDLDIRNVNGFTVKSQRPKR